MPSLTITRPALVRISDLTGPELERLKRFLTFEDGSVKHLISKHRSNARWKRNDPEGWTARMDELKEQLKRCILFEDDNGHYTYSGLAGELVQSVFFDTRPDVRNPFRPPEPEGMAWAVEPEHEERYYQKEAEDRLIEAVHAGIEMGTGLGKSRILMDLTKRLGLQTLIVAPSTSILTQLVKDFQRHLGERYVGQYGDGKKKFDRQVTIATFQSLTKLEPGDEAWEALKTIQVFMVDESHMCPASTLEKVCMGLAKDATYRFFVSATQVRGDGSGLVLKGVTGPIVYTMSVQEGVEKGFLAKPTFHMIRVRSDDRTETPDVMKMTRLHHYYNPRILQRAAEIANMAVLHLKHRVLIQVEEITQFQHLLPHLQFDPRFAHGAAKSDKEMRKKLPEKYWDSDPSALAEAFNNEEFPILVGTSCIGTGTDIRVPETIINLMAGASPIGIPQAVGRGTRRCTFADGRKKTSFNFIDFVPLLRTRSYNDAPDVDEQAEHSPMYRHGLKRAAMYRDLYPNVRWK